MPSVNGGDQLGLDYDPSADWKPVELPTESVKYDFENLEARMYLALKDLLVPWAEGQEGNHIAADNAAQKLIEEYELSLGPCPEWSTGFNVLREIKQGAQLLTKDGRQIGNAWVTSNALIGPVMMGATGGPRYFDVYTDAGSKCTLNENEINQMFHIGLYFSDPDHVFRRFPRT